MYRRPLIPPSVSNLDTTDVTSPDSASRGPDEVTFEVTGGSVVLLVPPDCPDDAVFDQDCPIIYCQLCLEDKLILEAWIPEDAPFLTIREQTTGQPDCGTGWGP
ncbi:MAG: hypothetical protein ACE5LU_06060 [Anaerolineae bacterium]